MPSSLRRRRRVFAGRRSRAPTTRVVTTIKHVKTDSRSAPRRAATGRKHSPTRETLLRMLESQRTPTSIAALASATGWHPNTVRGHVHALWEDGYLTRTREEPGSASTAGGRPSWLWHVKNRAPESPYAALAGVLAETLARVSPAPEHDALAAGRSWGLALGADLPAAHTTDQARRTVVETLRDQGFAPQETAPGQHRDTVIELRQCPLIEAAAKHTEIVCAVHRGMVAGVLEAVGASDGGSELLPFTAPGHCTLRLRVAE